EHPLLSLDFHDRWKTQCTCVCCPTSVARFAAQTKEYAYAKDDNSLYVILYGSNEIDTEVAGNNVKFEQASNYPWSGDVTLSYMGDRGAEFDLKLRIPEWAQGATLCINGESVATAANSFATVSRKWKRGDKVELVLPMTPTLIEADPRVEQLRNQVAVTCGPLVYCLEAIDLPENIAIEDVMIPLDGSFSLNYQESLLGGVNTITTDALYRKSSFEQSGLYAPIKGGYDSIELTLIPYYAWANRGECEMTVFMPTKW
ncbi:MAG: glycoside hydrolase family 127 protein, partial [Rikenellaceae bacterium]